MKKIPIIILLVVAVTLLFGKPLYAAKLILVSPKTAAANGEPFAIQVFVDPEGYTLSGLSGVLTFPSEQFDVASITTQSSIVSLWVTHPRIVEERTFEGVSRILFEGIVPGGFSGVRSPFYQGERPGLVFTVSFFPKQKGLAKLSLNDIELHLYDEQGTKVYAKSSIAEIKVPEMIKVYTPQEKSEGRFVKSNTLKVTIAQDQLIDNNSWYINVNEDESARPINHIEVAESGEYDFAYVSSYAWHRMTNPYVLLYQSRVKYIHIKVVYENGTYATRTIPPVEKSLKILSLSYILLIILIVVAILYHYRENILQHLSKYFFRHRRKAP